MNDLDANLKELRSRLKEARADLQKSEDNNAALKAQLSQAQNEVLPLRQVRPDGIINSVLHLV